MESFDIGNHVVIELDDDRKLAGYIVGVSDDGSGIILKATHKEMAMIRYINPLVSKDIRRQLMAKPMRTLRLAAVLNGKPLAALGGREELVSLIQGVYEARVIAEKDDGVRLRELSTPVLTFVNTDFIKLMEDTDDKLTESEVSTFNQTFESELKDLLDKADEETTKEETNDPS
jgi:hypothetical protein